MALTTRKYTFEDLLAMPEGDEIYEILGGELVVFTAPNSNHAFVVGELFDLLRAAQQAGYGYAFTAPFAVVFDFDGARQDVTHPDLLFIRRGRRGIIGPRCVEAAPDLVVEVLSPSTRDRDLVDKRRIYERYGVPHSWIVDPAARAVQQFEMVDGRYPPPRTLRRGQALTCPLFPGLSLDLAKLFANVAEAGEMGPG